MTQAQGNLADEVLQTIRDAINARIAAEVNADRIESAKHIQHAKEALIDDVYEHLRRRHRIGRPKRKQTELNP